MFRRLLIATVFNIVAIFIASAFISGIDYGKDFWILVIAGFVFGLVNMFVKPIITVLSIPLVIVTFGIFLFFINVLMLYITSWIVPSFNIDSFWDAVGAAIIIWLVNLCLEFAFDLDKKKRKKESAESQ